MFGNDVDLTTHVSSLRKRDTLMSSHDVAVAATAIGVTIEIIDCRFGRVEHYCCTPSPLPPSYQPLLQNNQIHSQLTVLHDRIHFMSLLSKQIDSMHNELFHLFNFKIECLNNNNELIEIQTASHVATTTTTTTTISSSSSSSSSPSSASASSSESSTSSTSSSPFASNAM